MDQAQAPGLLPVEFRIAGRLTVGFMLDLCESGRMNRSMLDALLLAAVVDANLNRLYRDPELQMAYARLDSNPPDDLRRPVSINALAASLRFPFETVRRHVNQLVRQGALVSGSNGVYAPSEFFASPAVMAALRRRYDRLFRFYADLRQAELVEALPCAPLPVDHPDSPVRAVARILSDYFFRTLDLLHRQVPDVLTSMVMMDVVREGSEPITPATAAAALGGGWTPEGERAPVRVAHVARRLSIPYETARRHVAWLVDHGFCCREGGGVLVSPAYVRQPSLYAVATENLTNARRMFRQIGALLMESGLGAEARAAGN